MVTSGAEPWKAGARVSVSDIVLLMDSNGMVLFRSSEVRGER